MRREVEVQHQWHGIEGGHHFLPLDLQPQIHKNCLISMFAEGPLYPTVVEACLEYLPVTLINCRVWAMKPDAESIVNEAVEVYHYSWDKGEDVFFFVYGPKEVGECGSWRHPHTRMIKTTACGWVTDR